MFVKRKSLAYRYDYSMEVVDYKPVGWAVGLGALVYSLRNENLDSISKKFNDTLKASTTFARGNYDLATIIVVQICANRIILNQEKTKEIENLTSRVTQEKERQEQLATKAEMVELQLKRIIEEKKNLDQEVQQLSTSIFNCENSINTMRRQLI